MLVLTCHERLPLSSPRLRGTWRFMAKWFCGSGFAVAVDVMRCSGFASTAIAGSAIAAPPAAPPHDFSRGAAPTVGISGVLKAGWIIVTGNVRTGAAGRKPA